MLINGWQIYFYPLFANQRLELREEVRKLKGSLPQDEYRSHPTVKRYAALMKIIKEHIPRDPYHSMFALSNALISFKRAKGLGLSARYRLFFKVVEANNHKAIFILWLGYPRKEGDKNDCYAQFKKQVLSGNFPSTYKDLLDISENP